MKYPKGQWSFKENQRFMHGLQKYGRDWPNVQKVVRTRSLTQVRSHAQKVFKHIEFQDQQALFYPGKTVKPIKKVKKTSTQNEKAKNDSISQQLRRQLNIKQKKHEIKIQEEENKVTEPILRELLPAANLPNTPSLNWHNFQLFHPQNTLPFIYYYHPYQFPPQSNFFTQPQQK